MADNNLRQEIIDVIDELGAAVDTDIEQVNEIDDNVTLPGIRTDENGNFVSYIVAKMSVFHSYVKSRTDSIVATWNGWFGTSEANGVQKDWKDLRTDAVNATNAANNAAQNTQQAISNANAAASNANTKAGLAEQAASNANEKAGLANEAASNASSIYNTVRGWFEGVSGFRSTAEGWLSTIQSTWSSWFGASDSAGVRKTWNDWISATRSAWTTWFGVDATTAGGVQKKWADLDAQARSDHNTAVSDHTTAQNDHTASEAATTGALNVNAELNGMTVRITNRQGVSREVNIGFEILAENVYPSVEAMIADAANVRAGRFCMIATTDPTSEDNAQLWSRNSSAATSAHPFTFLSDLDQASTAAFADWLNNYKPVIESDHSRAESDHSRAESDHSRAETDHSTATGDHNQATGDHNQAGQDHSQYQQDHQTSASQQTTFEANELQRQQTFQQSEQTRQNTFNTNEAQRQQDFEDAESERMAAMVVTKCFVDVTTMCLMFVQPDKDSTVYKVRNGNLNIDITFDV